MDTQSQDPEPLDTSDDADPDDADSPTFDPDEPTPAVGWWLSLDPHRLGLPPLAWLFVAGAGLLIWLTVTMNGTPPLEFAPFASFALGLAVGVLELLLPAALLRRAPDAPQRHPLLFAGLALGSLVALIAPSTGLWSADDGSLGSAARASYQVLILASPILVGLGLIALRGRRPGRIGLLVAVALVYLVGIVGQLALYISLDWGSTDLTSIAPSLAWALVAAFAAWVPVSAWLDRESPRRFWGLLAAAFPLWVLGLALGILGNLASREQFGGLAADLGSVVFGFVWAMPPALGFIAYGWLTPIRERPADTGSRPLRTMLQPSNGA